MGESGDSSIGFQTVFKNSRVKQKVSGTSTSLVGAFAAIEARNDSLAASELGHLLQSAGDSWDSRWVENQPLKAMAAKRPLMDYHLPPLTGLICDFYRNVQVPRPIEFRSQEIHFCLCVLSNPFQALHLAKVILAPTFLWQGSRDSGPLVFFQASGNLIFLCHFFST